MTVFSQYFILLLPKQYESATTKYESAPKQYEYATRKNESTIYLNEYATRKYESVRKYEADSYIMMADSFIMMADSYKRHGGLVVKK